MEGEYMKRLISVFAIFLIMLLSGQTVLSQEEAEAEGINEADQQLTELNQKRNDDLQALYEKYTAEREELIGSIDSTHTEVKGKLDELNPQIEEKEKALAETADEAAKGTLVEELKALYDERKKTAEDANKTMEDYQDQLSDLNSDTGKELGRIEKAYSKAVKKLSKSASQWTEQASSVPYEEFQAALDEKQYEIAFFDVKKGTAPKAGSSSASVESVDSVSAAEGSDPLEYPEETAGPVSDKKREEAMGYYQEGLRHYLKRNFQKASEEWQKCLMTDADNKKAKEYLDKAQKKYLESLNLFFDGRDFFEAKKYEDAAPKFEDSLMINPLNEKVKYYLKLCFVPVATVKTPDAIFSVNKDNAFQVSLDFDKTVQGWIDSWKLSVKQGETELAFLEGKEKIAEQLPWRAVDAKGNAIDLEGEVDYKLVLTSFYGSVETVDEGKINIDNKGPELTIIVANTNFTPEDETGENPNTVKFSVKAKDTVSGVRSIDIEIWDKDQAGIIASFSSKEGKPSFDYKWDGVLQDGTKLQGGTSVLYRIVSFDRSSNQTVTPFKKIQAEILVVEEETGFVMNLPNIEFQFGKASLEKSSYAILDQVGMILNLEKFQGAQFVVGGHTDNVGDEIRNQQLSEKRASSVVTYLTKKFNIDKDQIETKGYGESRPIATNDTDEGRKQNRRVEIVIMKE